MGIVTVFPVFRSEYVNDSSILKFIHLRSKARMSGVCVLNGMTLSLSHDYLMFTMS